MNKKLKSVSAIFMAFCLAVTMSSTSLFAVVADAIENSTEQVTQEQLKDESNQQEDKTSKETSSQNSNLGWYDTEKTSFTISSEEDLVLLSKIVNGTAKDASGNKIQDSFKGKTIKLKEDLNLKGVDIAPIGTSENQFEGTFNGNEKTIKLSISSEEGNQALFAYNKGTIKNLEITGSVSGKEYVAGLVVNNQGTIKNINSSVIVTAKNDYAGGIVAKNDGTIERCNNTGEVSAFRFTGGIAGVNSYNVTKCTNSATISCTGNDTNYNAFKGTGGITGGSKGTQEKPFKISDCYNTGKIVAGYIGGGITGWVQNGQVINCYNTGYCEGAWTIGGIAGGVMEYSKTEYSVVENCFNYADIHIGNDVTNNAGAGGRYEYQYAGGIAGFMQSGHVFNCYNAGVAHAVMQAGGISGGNYNGTATVIQNCITTKNATGSSYIGAVVGWWNTTAAGECTGNVYYEDLDDETYAKIASKLNEQVTDENGYYGWKYEDGKISQARVYDINFKVKPEDATVVVKNSEGTKLSPVEENLYMLPNGDYTYEVSKDGYKTKTRSFSVKNSDDSYIIKLASNDALWDGNEDTSWYNAEKTTFEISSNAQLAGLSKLVYEGNNFEGKVIKLSKDLNLNDKDWTGIGTSENQFMGTFDGLGCSISNVKSSVFKYIGSKGKVINLGILENGALADTNAGQVMNCYNISDSSLVLNNSNTVTNCYTSTNNAVVKSGKEAVDSYYIDGKTYTKKDLSNKKIANLLNKNVTLANKEYMDWNVVDKETVHEKSYIAKFNLKSNLGEVKDATITLYDKEGNEINKESSKNFMLEDGTFRLINGQYTYKIAADRYAVRTGSLTIANENITIDEKLVDAYQVLFNITPEDATLIVKDSEGNVIVANEGTKYFLTDGKYTYEVKKTGYEAQAAEFEVKGADLDFNVKLKNVYKISFVSNVANARDFKVEVYKDSKLVEAQEDGTYLLTNGKYTYKAFAKGYAEVNKEFEVNSSELSVIAEFDTAYDISWYDSSKTSFEISNDKQLAGLGAIVNGYTDINDTFNSKTITITNDINVDKVLSEWLPIGTKSKKFTGKFDGQNHTITLNIDTPDQEYVGLFSIISSNAEIRNVIVAGNITGKNYVGGIAGSTDWHKALENCVNKATITGESYVGGIIGNQGSYNVYTNNCVNKGTVTGKQYVGGICGYLRQAQISNCCNEGNVKGETNVGGIGGIVLNSSDVKNCYNTANVTGTKYIGGIIGDAGQASVNNAYNTGIVTGESYVGGIAGKGLSQIANIYNIGDVKATGNYIGGIIGLCGYEGSTNYFEVSNCYNKGNVTVEEASTNVGVIVGAGKLKNAYYIDSFTKYTDNQGEAFTQEDFENGNLVKKLNQNLKLAYKIWGVKDKQTVFTDESIQKGFYVFNSYTYEEINDYEVELKDSEGNIVNPHSEGNYVYSNLKLNEKYTYTINAKTFNPTSGTFTYNGKTEQTSVGLSYIKTTTTLNINVENPKVTLTSGFMSVSPNSDGKYSLSPGTYSYKVLADGYPMKTGSFTIDIVEKDEPKVIDIELTKGYNVEFTSDSTTDQKVEVKNSSNTIMETTTPNKYNLNPGKYTYTLKADGYETVTGEFEVVDKDLDTISVKLNKVYNLDWYDKNETEYTLNTKEDLLGFFAILNNRTTSVSGEQFSGKTIKLANNIELNSDDKFIENEDGTIKVSDDIYTLDSGYATFYGTFDGNNKTIKGMYKTTGALFNYNYGTIKDLTVTGYIKSTSNIAGIVVFNYGTVTNCTNKVTLQCTSYSGVGGIAYQNSNAKIINCKNEANLKAINKIGGISYYASNSTLKNNINTGDIVIITDTGNNAGGIVSDIVGKTDISNNYNLGNVTGNTKIGGIVGNVNDKTNKTVKNNINYGNIKGKKGQSGSIIGFVINEDTSTVDIANNFYKKGTFDGAVMSQDIEDKAVVKTTKELADGSVATLLNSAVTDENGYKSWTVENGKTVFGNSALAISVNVTGATIKLYDYKGNEIKSIPGTNGVYDDLRKGSLYKYEVSKDGLNTETGTVIIGNDSQFIYVELSATVYVTVSKDGEFKLSDDEETTLTRIPVTATNFDVTDYGYPSIYNSDDYPTLLNVFIKFHELYAGGVDNFAGKPNNTPATGNDLFITKFLGIETTQLTYYVNNQYPGEWLEEQGYMWGSAADYIKMKNNDDVNVTLFTDYQVPMFYTYFDKQEATVKQGQNLELNLKGFNNADAYLAPEGKAISGSTIYIDGEETEIVTDKEGKATLMFDEPGTYIVSAQGTDLSLSDTEETVITAPVCEVTVTEAEDITVSFDANNGSEVVTKVTKPGKVLNYMPTAPTKEGYTFVGWYTDTDDITTAYKQGMRFTQSTTYKAKWAHVTMLGAQGKMVSNGKSGIRFGTKIYNDGDKIVEKGTLILPANLLAEGEALTLDTPNVAKSVANTLYEVNAKQNYVTYLGTIVNIPKAQFERQMTAAAYVVYQDKAGNQYTVYAPYANGSISVLDLLGNDIDWGQDW